MSAIEAFCSEGCALAKRNNRMATARKPNNDDIPAVVRELILVRDKVCQMCRYRYGLHIHHVYYRSEADKAWRHDESNLILLCHSCHDTVHSDKNKYQPLLLDMMNRRVYNSPNGKQEEES